MMAYSIEAIGQIEHPLLVRKLITIIMNYLLLILHSESYPAIKNGTKSSIEKDRILEILNQELDIENQKLSVNKTDELALLRVQIRIEAFEYYKNFIKKEG